MPGVDVVEVVFRFEPGRFDVVDHEFYVGGDPFWLDAEGGGQYLTLELNGYKGVSQFSPADLEDLKNCDLVQWKNGHLRT